MVCAAVALSRDLPAGHVMRSWVDGQELAVWRSAGGALAAWPNRCPHRGMRLSYGAVRGEELVCLYHGWRFENATGQCRHIPARPDARPPAAARMQSHAVTESGGLVWVAVNGPALPPDTGAARLPLRSLTFDCGARKLRAVFCNWLGNDGAIPDTRAGRDGTGLILPFSFNGLAAVLVLHPSPEGVTVHALTADGAGPALRTGISRWLEELRRTAETEAPAGAQEA